MKKALLIMAIVVLSLVFASCGEPRSEPSPTPTATAQATATAQKVQPYYGGPIQDFLNWYGQPMDDQWKDGRYDFRVWENNPYIGLIVDADGNGTHANIVWLMAPTKVSWTQQQAQKYCTPFLPKDAKLLKKNTLVWVYTSSLIKATVNPSGIFHISYEMRTDPQFGPPGINGCIVKGGSGASEIGY